MPIKIEKSLPAVDILKKENIFVMDSDRASHQDIRPIKILILNLMPQKIVTETQLLRLLANTPLQLEVEFLYMASHKSKNTSNEYLENYYRPNLRVKNRDGCTPLGPWLTDRDDIANPMALALTTRVNGVTTQTGSTADMIFDISTLIAYLSSFMTLNPGDVILTGTPEGLADVKAGDVVETEIEGLGCLVNRIVDDQTFFAQR